MYTPRSSTPLLLLPSSGSVLYRTTKDPDVTSSNHLACGTRTVPPPMKLDRPRSIMWEKTTEDDLMRCYGGGRSMANSHLCPSQ